MALYPIPTLASHDTRFPDANPIVGGPYLGGYTPNSALILGVPSATLPVNKTSFDSVSLATIRSEASSGDLVGVPVKYNTEDHLSIPQPL